MLITCKSRITNQKNWYWNVKARWVLLFITEISFCVELWTCPILPLIITVWFYNWKNETIRMTLHQLGQRMSLLTKIEMNLLAGLALGHNLIQMHEEHIIRKLFWCIEYNDLIILLSLLWRTNTCQVMKLSSNRNAHIFNG